MNKDQIKGNAKQAAGKVQEATGKLLCNKTQQVKGMGKQLEGAVQKNVGNAHEAIENAKAAMKGASKSR